MKKKSNYWWEPNYDDKPRKWKFVSKPFIYSSDVEVIDDENGEFLGYIELQYKLVNRQIDIKWVNDNLEKTFGRITKIGIKSFKRDGTRIDYISDIYLIKSEYKQTLRELKLKRILNSY